MLTTHLEVQVQLTFFCVFCQLDLPSLYNDATVNDGLGRTEYSILLVNKNNVANIENVGELHIWDGELSDVRLRSFVLSCLFLPTIVTFFSCDRKCRKLLMLAIVCDAPQI